MARSFDTVTKLPLDEWARMFGINPLHFNGVEQPDPDPGRTTHCASPWFQYSWQATDKVSREEVAIAIYEAEQQVEEYLGYHIAPAWDYDEWKATTRPQRADMFVNNSRDVRGYNRTIFLDWKYFIEGGVEAATLLQSAQPVYYEDDDNDGYKETAIVQWTSAVDYDVNELEIHACASTFPSNPYTAAIVNDGYAESNRVYPLAVNKSGTGPYIYTFIMRREQLVLIDILTDVPVPGQPVAVDGADDDNFYSTLCIWRHYTNPAGQATLVWEGTGPCGSCTGLVTCSVCGYTTQDACLTARGDPRLSVVGYRAALWDADELTFTEQCQGRDPDSVRAYYRSGWRPKRAAITSRVPTNYNGLDPFWARIIANFAASKLERPICDCGPTAAQIEHASQDLAYQSGPDQFSTFGISQKDLQNPFGTKRGAVAAWKAVDSRAIGRAVTV